MTLAFSVSLTLGAGLYVDAGAPAGTPVLKKFECPYGLRLEGASRMAYGDLGHHRLSARFPYWLTQPLAIHHAAEYAITHVNPLHARHTSSWALLHDASLQAVVNTPELVWHGQRIRILDATLSCDEESPVWMAQIGLAAMADFAAIEIGDTLTLTLGLEDFVLVVDGKTLSRASTTDQRMELTAVSPIALKDAPFAGTISLYQPNASSARAVVESLIGTVSWHLPDWIIPAGRLMLEGTTPLAAARNIVAAIGGVIESNPDGSVICRRRHPVSIPYYATATVAHSLFDHDVISTRAQIAPMRGYNRLTIANDDGSAGASEDRIEYIADIDDAYRGTVRAWLATERAVVLAHTGHPATIIADLGKVIHTETETIEFIAGKASTKYPVTALINTVWQHTDLGAITVDGQTLIAATPGYSLARITYTTTSLDWRVALPIDEEVQFLLVDA